MDFTILNNLSLAMGFTVERFTKEINGFDVVDYYKVDFVHDSGVYAIVDVDDEVIEYYAKMDGCEGYDIEINVEKLEELKTFCEAITRGE